MPETLAVRRAWGNTTRTRPIMLAIAGDSATGKTTLARGLVEALGSERITAICVDDYHRYDREERRSLGFTPLHPACNYVQVMEQHLQLLALASPSSSRSTTTAAARWDGPCWRSPGGS